VFSKVLIFSPIHWVKEYSIPLWARSILDQDFPKMGVDYLVVDTSEKKWEIPAMENFICETIKIDQTPCPDIVHKRLVAACNLARDMVLSGNYSHLFVVECDVICQPDALRKLYEADKPQIEGLYYTDFDFWPREWWTMGDTIQPGGARGTLGVSLIKKEVLEKVSFRYDPNLLGAFHDAMFHYDAEQLGYHNYIHTGVICQHLMDGRKNRGWGKINFGRK
jgi:hypothetical protein